MNKVLTAMALACMCAAAAAADQPAQAATPAASAASAPGGLCVRERITTQVVNGKAVQIRRQEYVPDCPKQAVRLWD